MRIRDVVLTEAVSVVARIDCSPDALSVLSDDDLVAASTAVASARQHLDSYGALIAAELARRSRRELGHAGLAQREGYRNPEAFLQHITGGTRSDARALMNVGTMLAEAEAEAPGSPDQVDEAESASFGSRWRSEIADAVTGNRISVAQADAISGGLGECSEIVTAASLAERAALLLQSASDPASPMPPEELRRVARQLRDVLDTETLAAQDSAQRGAQYIRAWKRSDGMVAGSLLLDKENGAYLLSVLDEITSPRRGGPRFMSDLDRARERRFADDPRSTERIAAESLIDLVRQGAAADPAKVLGSRKPAVRIIVTREALQSPDAPGSRGVIERTGESVPMSVAERHICEAGTMQVTVDPIGRPLDVGRDQRLFTERQRVALAIRDGGCMWPDCDHPPSWTEAHHGEHWAEHRGRTDTADGILLCRFHHLLLHNGRWRILRRDVDYFLQPPPGIDPRQTLRPLRSKSSIMRERRAGPASAAGTAAAAAAIAAARTAGVPGKGAASAARTAGVPETGAAGARAPEAARAAG